MNEVFWEDAATDFGFFDGVGRDYRPLLMAIERGTEATYHMTACPQIEFEGEDKAHVECYGVAGGRTDPNTQIYGGCRLRRSLRPHPKACRRRPPPAIGP